MKFLDPREDEEASQRIEDMIDDTFSFSHVTFVRDGDDGWWAQTSTPGRDHGFRVSNGVSFQLDYPNDGGLISNLEHSINAALKVLAEKGVG